MIITENVDETDAIEEGKFDMRTRASPFREGGVKRVACL